MTFRGLIALDRQLGAPAFTAAALAVALLDAAVRIALTTAQDLPNDAIPMLLGLVPSLTNALATKGSNVQLLVWIAWSLVASFMLTVLALRRAAHAGVPAFVATLAMIPLLRLPVILVLALPLSVPDAGQPPVGAQLPSGHVRWRDAALAVLVGASLTVFSVVLGALCFGSYQYSLFVLAPFFIGAASGYIVNRRADAGLGGTTRVALLSTVVGSLALLGLALEGAICIVLAAPLAFVAAWFGGVIGRALVRFATHRRANAIGGLFVLPLALGLDSVVQRPLAFELESSIDIAAPPSAVWNALANMNAIREEPELLFRVGVSYPISAGLEGTGVGALRRSVFSTGVALERVTVREAEGELGYEMISEPPSMREMSFYDEVHAPHVHGYFSTVRGSFRLERLSDERTRLVSRTEHRMRLEPAAYWLYFARHVVTRTQQRALRHLKEQAEGTGR
jgi:hypothetical protein